MNNTRTEMVAAAKLAAAKASNCADQMHTGRSDEEMSSLFMQCNAYQSVVDMYLNIAATGDPFVALRAGN